MKTRSKAFTLIFISKIIVFIFLVFINKSENPENFYGIASYTGDAISYINPMDNFIELGVFSYDSINPTVYRPPYYGLFYLPLRLCFNKSLALSILVIIQLLFEIIATYLLYEIALKLFKHNFSVAIFMFLILCSLYISDYSYRILTESFSVSFLIISFYFFFEFLEKYALSKIIVSGIFFSLVILLKPYFGIFYLIFGAALLVHFSVKKIKLILKISLLFFLPLAILSSPWIVRNYIHFKKIIPFNQYNHSKLDYAFRDFITARGQSFVHWDHNSAGCYFLKTDDPCNFIIKPYFVSKSATEKMVEEVRKEYLEYQISEKKDTVIENQLINKFNRLTESYINEKPLQYYFLSKLRLIKISFINSGSFYLPYSFNEANFFLKILKLLQSVLYYIAVLGIFFSIYFTVKKRKYVFLFATPLYLILFFNIFLKACEWRFFFHFYPFAIFSLCLFVDSIFDKKMKVTQYL